MKKHLIVILIVTVVSLVFLGGGMSTSSAEKPVTITMLHYMGNEVKLNAFNSILKKYRDMNPHVNFDVQAISQTEYFTQLRIRIASGDTPDIMMGQPSQYPDIIETGYVMDLSKSELVNQLKLTGADIGDSLTKAFFMVYHWISRPMGSFTTRISLINTNLKSLLLRMS